MTSPKPPESGASAGLGAGPGPLTRLEILARAIDAMEIGVTITDADRRITYTNAADARMHGYTVAELVGRRSTLFAPDPDAAESVVDSPAGSGWLRERLNRRRDGTVFPVRLFSEEILDPSGTRIATVTLCEDLSDEVGAASAIARRDRVLQSIGRMTVLVLSAEKWSKAMTESLSDLLTSTEADGAVFVPDPSVARRTGSEVEPVAVGPATCDWSPLAWYGLFEEWEDPDPDPIVLPEHEARLPEQLRRELSSLDVESALLVPAVVSETVLGVIALLVTKPGRSWTPGELDAMRIAGRLLGAWQERRRSEIALAQAEKGYRELVEGGSDLIVSLTTEGRHSYVNPAWCAALGFSASESNRLTIFDVVEPSRRDACRGALERLTREGSPVRLQTVFRSRDGRALVVEGSISARTATTDEPTIVGIFRDVTERAELERLREEFISTVNHELRTPLTSILGSLSLLLSPQLRGSSEQSDDLLRIAHRNSERLLKLVNDLLDLQKLAAGSVQLELEPVPLGELIDEVVETMRKLAEPLGIELDSSVSDPGAALRTDRKRIGQILGNLLSNAIRFSPRSARVRLVAGVSGDWVAFRVEDDGPGIPLDFQRRLFERFSQTPGSRKSPRIGSGLGLAIVKRLVDLFGGTITLDSAPGRGTKVLVELPLEVEDGVAAATEREVPREPRPRSD